MALGVRTKILILCISCTLVALVLQTLFFQYSASSIIYRQEQEASQKSLEHMQCLRILREITGRRRHRLFVYDRYMEILNEGTEPLR